MTTFLADGMACRVPDDAALEVILGNVDRIVRVTEEEIRMAMRFYFTDTHNVVEGAGAAGLAAALKERQLIRGKRIGLVATGGNVDHDVFARVLQIRESSLAGGIKIVAIDNAHRRVERDSGRQ